MHYLTGIDWAALFKIVGVDISLGVDNAVVIALAAASLQTQFRRKALMLGTAAAVATRAVLLPIAGFIIGVPFVKFIAGAYLLYLGYTLLCGNASGASGEHQAHDGLWAAIRTIIVADFMMSLDNVLAVAATATDAPHSTLYAIAGITFSIPVLMFGAGLFSSLMTKLPVIVWLGAGLLGWVGTDLMTADPLLGQLLTNLPGVINEHGQLMFSSLGFAAVVLSGLVSRAMARGRTGTAS